MQCKFIYLLPGDFSISAILPELLDNFENASAEVVQCPDLTQPPFNLTSEGEHKCIPILTIFFV